MELAQAPELCVATTAQACTGILSPGVNVLWWRRAQPPAANLERDFVMWLPHARAIEMLRPHVADALYQDVSKLVELYFELAQPPAALVKLETVRRRQCPLLHVDAVGLRLISTYSGSGTQWALNDDVQRHELGWKDDANHDAANTRMLKPGAGLLQAEAGDVLILKGEAWAGNENNGVVHVSPPLQPGETRVRLVIDAAAATPPMA